MKFITVALLALIVVCANAFARIRQPRDIDAEQWQKQIDQYVSESTTPEDLKEKVSEYYSKLTEKQSDFVQFYRKQCTAWIKGVASDEEKAELKALYANKDGDVLAGKINDYVNRLSENERAPVLLWKNACAYLWNIDIPTESINARVRRSTTSHNILSTEWLTDEQIDQLSGLENDEYDKKYLQFFKELSGETKDSASKKIVKKCYGWLEEVATQDERDELKDLHHKDHSKCKEKVQEYLGRVPEAEKAHIKEHLDVCEEIWYAEHGHDHEHKHHHHRRRRHHEHSFEDFAKEHLGWLTDDQKAEAMKVKDDKAALKAKMKEFFEATTGEKRQEATESMKGACRQLLKHVLGDEKSGELKTMKESGATPEALKTKLEEFLNGITDEHLKEEANDHKEECMKVLMTPARKRRDHHHGHKLEDYLKTHLSWLTTEQGETLKQMKADGKTPSELQKKVFEFYEATSGETKTKATELLKGGCRDLIKSVVGDEKAEELKKLKESGASDSTVSDKIKSYIAEVVDPQKKELAVSYEGACKKIFGVASRKRRDHHHGHKLEDYLKTHLSWLTTEQGETLKQMKTDNKSPEELQKKVFEFYEATTGETRVKATELLQGGCRDLIQTIVGQEKAQELRNMRESGASVADINAKVKEFMGEIEDEEKKQLASKYEGACKKIFGVQSSRKRREHDHEDDEDLEAFAKNHLTWLTDEQRQEVINLKDSGNKAVKAKIHEFYNAATGETKDKATLELQNACKELINTVIGEEHAAILKGLRDSGADIGEIQKKVDEFLAQVPDEKKRKLAETHQEGCAQMFLTSSSRRLRRDKHHEHTLKEFADNHLSWLSAEQKAEILELDGQKEAVKAKINEFFEKTSGDEREKAVASFQAACRERLVHVLGDEKAAELKTMRESGATNEALLKKTEELLAAVEDETLKKEADEHKEDCLKVFGIKSRKIRDCGFDVEKHLTWLTDDQKDTLTQMKAEKKAPQEIHKKIFEFYDATEGETRTKAKELMQGGCRDVLLHVLGEEKSAELKAMKESGASNDELSSKIKDFMDEIQDPKKKDYAVAYEGPCKRIFGVGSRKRRDHGHKLEDYLKTHLSWLTTEQGETLKQMKADGKTPSELQKKVFEFYEATTGETKTKATELLKGGCRDLIKSVVGDEKAEELKKLKESGASDSAVSDKIKSYIAEVEDPQKKELAVSYEGACKKIFGVASRKKRHEGKHGIDDFVNNHLSWLNAEQKTEIDKLKVEGNFAGIKARVNTFFEAATGETKEKATEELKGACRELYQDILGEKANEVKTMKESGASDSDLAKKIDELISGITDEAKKAKAEEYKADCKRIFGVQSRKKRMHDHGKEHDLEDYFKNHYSWLSEDQKNELRQLKKDGKKDEIWNKSLEYYDAATGEVKEKAQELMKGGCRELIRVIIGNEKADEVTAMKESGASVKDMDAKLQEFVGEVTDEGKKVLAKTYGPGCRRIFGVASRKRREHDHGEHKLEDYFKTHFSWLTDAQKDEMRQMKTDGKKAPELYAKAMEYYEAATGEVKEKAKEALQGGCRELIRVVVGSEKADELTAMRESGASMKDMDAKLQEFVGQVTDEGKKKLAGTYGPECRKIFGVDSRKRRNHDHGEHQLEDYFKTHYSWLSDEQKDELRQMKKDGKKDEIWNKSLEYYDAATGEVKEKAKELMKGGCRELIRVIIGNEKADEISAMKESGASVKDMDAKLQEFVGAVTDEGKKVLAKNYGPGCRRIFGVGSRKRRDHHTGHKLEDYLKTHLSWLTTEQGETLKQMKADGKTPSELQKKVFEFYESTTGETKSKATELLKGGCRDLIKSVVGDEKAEELKKLKESGASDSAVSDKIKSYIAEVEDPQKKELAVSYEGACKKIFGVASRKRREHDHGEHKLEDYFKSHLSWLSDEQKDELRQMKKDGKKDEIWKKSLDFYEATTGDVKEKAKELMQGGCRELIRVVIGNPKADELQVLKESGASVKALDSKLHEFLREVTDEGKKTLANTYGPGCRKVFGVSAEVAAEKRKRRAFHPTVTHMDFIRAVVGNEDKPEPSHRALTYQIMDIYDGERLSERARNVVNQCHGLFGEIVQLSPYKNENSLRELLHLLRSASARQLKGIEAVAEVCKKTVEDLEETEGNHGSIGKTLIEMFKNLDDEPRNRLREQWKSKCLDWILDVTDAEEREDLKYLLRMGRIEVLQERVTELMSRFDDKTRTQVGHMRPVCENLLGFVHNTRKTFHRKVPVETVF